MSNIDFSRLVSAKSETADSVPKGLSVEDFYLPIRVLAFDQSLRNTAYVLARHTLGGVLVESAGMISPQVTTKGIRGDLERSSYIYQEAVALIGLHVDREVFHESPPNPAAVKGSGISSLLAAASIQHAAKSHGRNAQMFSAMTGKKMLTGRATADKKEAHQALMALDWLRGRELLTNEHERDAAIVALVAMRGDTSAAA